MALSVVRPREQEEWEARAGLDIGALIHGYLVTHPAPEDSRLVRDLREGSELLLDGGRAGLKQLGLPRFVALAGGRDGEA
jgi:hypothetical protein